MVLALLTCSSLYAHDCVFRLRYTRIDPEDQRTITGHGTAFAIGEEVGMTCCHNVAEGGHGDGDDHKNIEIEIDGAWYRVHILKKCAKLDVAMITVPRRTKFLKFAAADAQEGEKITAVGSLLNDAVQEYPGSVIERYKEGWSCDEIQCAFGHGISGAPILNKNGEVVGMYANGFLGDKEFDLSKHARGRCVPVSALLYCKGK